jgi:hypothetical protein
MAGRSGGNGGAMDRRAANVAARPFFQGFFHRLAAPVFFLTGGFFSCLDVHINKFFMDSGQGG